MTKDKQHLLELAEKLIDGADCAEDACRTDDDNDVYREGFEQLRSAAEAIQSLMVENERLREGLEEAASTLDGIYHYTFEGGTLRFIQRDASEGATAARTLLGDS